MKVSILIVTLNAGIELKETLDSVLMQKYEDFDVIVKDGLSCDDSIGLIPKDSRIRVVSLKDYGIYDAMNQAIEYVSGDVCIFMNSGDTFYDENVLCEIEKAIKTDGQLGRTIYYGDCYTRNRKSLIVYPDRFDDYMCFSKVLCHQATIYPVSLLKKRAFSTSYKIAADYEYYVHAYTHGIQLRHLPITIVNYKGGGTSESVLNRRRALKESLEIRKRNFSCDRYRKAWILTQLHGAGIKHLLLQQEWFYPFYERFAEFYYHRIIVDRSK